MSEYLSGFERFIGTFGAPLVLLLVAGAILWDRHRRKSKPDQVADGPPDEPYKVFTRAFDLELEAHRGPAALRDASPDFYQGWSDFRGEQWKRAIALAASAPPPDPRPVVDVLTTRLGSLPCPAQALEVVLLVDQSGSMRGAPIIATAGALAVIVETLDRYGVRTQVLGFSTAGWHGGHARQLWIKQGSPDRPGRLCALLHVIYKAGGDPTWSQASRDLMLHPDVLRENVDGEALDWACSRTMASPCERKILLVLSDGAPVDDSTLMQNGPSYLERHLLATIARIDSDPGITLGAIGIGHSVERYYRRSRMATPETIVGQFAQLLDELLKVTAGRC